MDTGTIERTGFDTECTHAVSALRNEIALTHPGLENLAAISVIAAKARKCLLAIAPSGTGKSAIAGWLAAKLPEAAQLGGITIAGLVDVQNELTDSSKALIMDDMGEAGGEYHREQIFVLLTALCYSHAFERKTKMVRFDVEGFYGSAWLGIQPNVLQGCVKASSWASNIKDKALRWYHLTRPTAPNHDDIDVPIEWGIPLDNVLRASETLISWPVLESIGRVQWSFARAKEHMHDLLRACAALDGRTQPDESDGELLLSLVRPMIIEREVLDKEGFDGDVKLNRNLLLTMVEFASYERLTYDHFSADYGMRPSQVQHVLEGLHEYYAKIQNSPVVLVPTDLLKDILRKAGIR